MRLRLPSTVRSIAATLRSPLLSYGLAVVLVASVALVRWGLVPALGRGTPATIVLIPSLLATRYGGVGPGLVAAVLSAVASEYWFLLPGGDVRSTAATVMHGVAFLLEGVAAVVLTAPVRSARLRAQAATRRMQAIYGVSTALGEATTVDEVARAILTRGAVLLGADAAAVFLASEDAQGPLRLMEHVEPDPGMAMMIPLFREVPIDSELPPAIAARRRDVVSSSNAQETASQFPALRELLARGMPPAFICAPMTVDGRLIGVLAAAFEHPHPIDSDDRNWAAAMAKDCAMAMDRAQLLEREKKARLRAQTAIRAKDAFFVAVSDALRAPLPAIRQGVQGLRTDLADRACRSAEVDVIARCVKTALRLVDSLIDLAHVAAHELALEMKPVDLGRLVRSCTDELRENARAAGVRLTTSLGADPRVIGDLARLQQAIGDLLANALRSTPPGGHVRVETESREGMAIVRVKDDGRGIPAGDLPYVFDAFRSSEGLDAGSLIGVQMAIAKYVADRHNGSIHLDSAGEGRGTTTTLELPVAPAEDGRALA
jgi:K+-sensing histidine kinase KdpD